MAKTHVVQAQTALAAAGYYNDKPIDGDFGKDSLGAVTQLIANTDKVVDILANKSQPVHSKVSHDKFFAWLKSKQPNGKLTQTQVDGMNILLAIVKPDVLQSAVAALNGWTDNKRGGLLLSKAGADMMKRYEGFKSAPYIDMVGRPTIGYGNTYYPDGRKVRMTDAHLTEPQAAKLKQDIINLDFASGVNKLFADEIASGALNQNMFDALVSLAYNIGIGALSRSKSITENIHKGNYQAAANGFLKYNNGTVNGVFQPIPGLTRRRTEERDLFLSEV